MLRPIITTLLIISILAQTFERLALALYLGINQEYIAKELCINRVPKKTKQNKRPPVNPCNGSCYWLKKGQEQTKREKNNPASSDSSKEVILFCENKNIQLIDYQLVIDKQENFFYQEKDYISPNFSIFHPPAI
ncbi:MAG: hypothetical protein MUE85_06380 [Microscillaceae bacterium]|jgi:hypothetical protein|nr:hypothetical protein [Microscillaceae bacterium]